MIEDKNQGSVNADVDNGIANHASGEGSLTADLDNGVPVNPEDSTDELRAVELGGAAVARAGDHEETEESTSKEDLIEQYREISKQLVNRSRILRRAGHLEDSDEGAAEEAVDRIYGNDQFVTHLIQRPNSNVQEAFVIYNQNNGSGDYKFRKVVVKDNNRYALTVHGLSKDSGLPPRADAWVSELEGNANYWEATDIPGTAAKITDEDMQQLLEIVAGDITTALDERERIGAENQAARVAFVLNPFENESDPTSGAE